MAETQLYPPDFDVRPIKVERPRRSNRRVVTTPKGATPIVRLVFGELARQAVRYQDCEDFSGVGRAAIKSWRRKSKPSWESLQSVLSALGFGFAPTPALQVLPPELAGEVTTLALKLGKSMPETISALIDIGVEQKLLRMDADERRALVEVHRTSLRGNKRSQRAPAANDNNARKDETA
jgi:hypothetical protein